MGPREPVGAVVCHEEAEVLACHEAVGGQRAVQQALACPWVASLPTAAAGQHVVAVAPAYHGEAGARACHEVAVAHHDQLRAALPCLWVLAWPAALCLLPHLGQH